MRQRGFYYTLDRGGTSLLGSALDDEGDAPPADVGCGGLAGALARRQRSALVALACPDLPPSALSGRGLHLQAQQRARCALGRHERGCVSGYRPHLRAAATARAVMAVHAGLATDEAAAARERQELQVIMREEEEWAQLHAAAQKYHEAYAAVRSLSSTRGEPAVVALEVLRGATAALAAAVSGLSAYIVASILSSLAPPSVEAAEERLRTTAFGPVLVGAGGRGARQGRAQMLWCNLAALGCVRQACSECGCVETWVSCAGREQPGRGGQHTVAEVRC